MLAYNPALSATHSQLFLDTRLLAMLLQLATARNAGRLMTVSVDLGMVDMIISANSANAVRCKVRR
jgi:hypothetical protein